MNRMNRHLLALVGLGCLSLNHASAQALAQPLWELGVAGGVISTPSYPGAADRETRALGLPTLIYRGKVFRSDQGGIGARLFKSDAAELDIGLAASLPARSDKVAVRAGMPNLGALAEFGPRLKVRLARFDAGSGLRLDLPLRAVVQVTGGVQHQGYTFEPRLVFEQRSLDGRWLFDTQLAAVVGDARINRYFYEVQPAYATANRPAYSADAGLILLRASAFASRAINPDLRVYAFLRAENYGAGSNRNSPLHLRDNGVSAGIGLSWTIARSSRLAGD
jgi:outer membrane scaffolding protein for murein synthesis (MipA/OmpV family)